MENLIPNTEASLSALGQQRMLPMVETGSLEDAMSRRPQTAAESRKWSQASSTTICMMLSILVAMRKQIFKVLISRKNILTTCGDRC